MAHLIKSFDFVEIFSFYIQPKSKSCLVTVEEFKTSVHISARRIGWELPEYLDLDIIVPKRTRDAVSYDSLRELAVMCVRNLILRDNLRYANV